MTDRQTIGRLSANLTRHTLQVRRLQELVKKMKVANKNTASIIRDRRGRYFAKRDADVCLAQLEQE